MHAVNLPGHEVRRGSDSTLGGMVSVVHLVRHGEVDNPDQVVYADLAGFGLSEGGRRQAAWASTHLAGHPIGAVYASPLDRARETAQVFALPHGLDPLVLPEVTEWALMSRWAGLPWADLDIHFPGELGAYLNDPLDLDFAPESVTELALRVGRAVDALADRHSGQEVVVVSHQDPIQAARLRLTGQHLGRLHQDKPRHCEVISLSRAAGWQQDSRVSPRC
ncbi:MAG: histidine phosphatase family protein [Acidimicrobiia bacterium]|nr:histidine phosphatase family protein [Acidimicrobiia bacterium]